MIGLFGRQGQAATLRQHCPQMIQRRCTWCVPRSTVPAARPVNLMRGASSVTGHSQINDAARKAGAGVSKGDHSHVAFASARATKFCWSEGTVSKVHMFELSLSHNSSIGSCRNASNLLDAFSFWLSFVS